MTDWTSKDGRANTSDKFNQLILRVAEIITDGGITLMTQGPKSVAGTIMAQLAHVHGMAPTDTTLELEMAERFKLLRSTLEAIGNGLPGVTEDELRTVAQGALLELADREVRFGANPQGR